MKKLSGGPLGGNEVEWPSLNLSENFTEYDGVAHTYVLQDLSDEQAVFKETIAIELSQNALDNYKQEINMLIDNEAERRIITGDGFEFPPGSGLRFSLSINAQSKWNGLAVATIAGLINFETNPPKVRTIDDTIEFTVSSAEIAIGMFGIGTTTVQEHLNLCREAKGNVLAATNYEEVNAAYNLYMGI